jgi:ribosome-binding factor A
MKFKRSARVSDQIQEEISDILLRDVHDPRIGFVTITEVRLSDDLKNARVFASVLGDEKQKKATMAGLRSATAFIQREVGHRLQLRSTPELLFTLDEGAERGAKIDTLLNQIKDEDAARAKKFEQKREEEKPEA